jgi:hypothetical protein
MRYARVRDLAVNALTFSLAAALTLAGPAAWAEQACWFENGVVVTPAQVLGVAGDYILDTATPNTQIAETQAQTAGFSETALSGKVRLAGLRLSGQPVAVAKLDMRTGALPTPIAGVIGADVLKNYVLEVRFSPCRIRLTRSGPERRAKGAQRLRINWIGGVPTIRAAVADGVTTLAGDFAIGVGADTAVRLSDAVAGAPSAAKTRELYPYGVLRPKLSALSFAGDLSQNLPAGLIAAQEGAVTGIIGGPLLARYRLRFDFPRGWLEVSPAP